MLYELGPRVVRAMYEENEGKAKYRVLAVILRYYDQFKPEKANEDLHKVRNRQAS